MKHTLILIFLLVAQICTYAQGNQIEAKAAYLLAEESFATGDYAATLEYLNTATESLGSTNSKLLYLQIQAELEIYMTDRSYYDQVIKTISDFQNSADVDSFTEEKVMEVAKTKMLLIKEKEQDIKNKEEADRKKIQQDLNFHSYAFKSWPFGVTFDELKITHKDRRFFQKKTKDRLEKNTGLTLYYPNEVSLYWDSSTIPKNTYFNDIFGILTKNNIVKGYLEVIYWVDHNTENTSHEKSLADLDTMVANISAYVGFEPEYENLDNKYYKGGIYSWSKKGKTIKLHHTRYVNGVPCMRVVQEIIVE
ncbi:hypothetical protein [Sphingobacterium haloxyli]|nr:hypothetical protein [Sphingobacterium haloxyli]